MLEYFVSHCHQILMANESSDTNQALDYLLDRNLSEKSIKDNQIGYCSQNTYIPDDVKHYGQDLDDPKKRSYLSFIKGRLIVPVCSEFGDVIGFATRSPTPKKTDGASWWNLPFKKGNHLFLLNKSRKSVFDKNKIYLVEGYMDALILYQEGLTNVAALMGTKLSTRAIGLIARYCDEVCFCLDVDQNESGQMGQDKAVMQVNEYGFCNAISVIDDLPVGEDPDVFVNKHGVEELVSNEKLLRPKQIAETRKRVQNVRS